MYIIRSFLMNQGLAEQVNYKAMTIHSVSFSLYNIAVCVYYAELFVYDISQSNDATRNGLIAWTFVTYTSFVSQLCLIWIFLQFRSK